MLLETSGIQKLQENTLQFNEETFHELLDALQKSQDLCDTLDKIIESFSDGIFIWDGNGIAIGANHAYENISGATRENIIGKHVKTLVEDLATNAGSLSVLETKKPVDVQYEFSITSKIALVSCTPIFDDAGNLF